MLVRWVLNFWQSCPSCFLLPPLLLLSKAKLIKCTPFFYPIHLLANRRPCLTLRNIFVSPISEQAFSELCQFGVLAQMSSHGQWPSLKMRQRLWSPTISSIWCSTLRWGDDIEGLVKARKWALIFLVFLILALFDRKRQLGERGEGAGGDVQQRQQDESNPGRCSKNKVFVHWEHVLPGHLKISLSQIFFLICVSTGCNILWFDYLFWSHLWP